jgi:ABC-type bacteriocin/lantibiotic exporter with double-glycine peptidase domain
VRHGEKLVLDVPVFHQREAECGNTSLKSVFWHLGSRLSAARLKVLARCNDEGTNHDGMIAAAQAGGFAVEASDGGTVGRLRAFLRRGHPVIVGWWAMEAGDRHFRSSWTTDERRARDCGHYSVVCGLDAHRLRLMDPSAGLRWMPIRDFLRVWYDTDTDDYVLVKRWYLVAYRV